MKHIKFILPNALTLINLLAGSVAIVLIFEGYIALSIYLLIAAAITDVMDGLAAKLLNAVSELGKQLDSLADLISFGLAPSVLMYKMIYAAYYAENNIFSINTALPAQLVVLFSSFAIAVFAALRLARFNIDTNTSPDFKGMPVPANALVVMSVWISASLSSNNFVKTLAADKIFLMAVIGFLSFLMVSKVPMISFKFKNLKLGDNYWRYLLILGSIIIFFVFGFSNLIIIMVYYIVLSILKGFFFSVLKLKT